MDAFSPPGAAAQSADGDGGAGGSAAWAARAKQLKPGLSTDSGRRGRAQKSISISKAHRLANQMKRRKHLGLRAASSGFALPPLHNPTEGDLGVYLARCISTHLPTLLNPASSLEQRLQAVSQLDGVLVACYEHADDDTAHTPEVHNMEEYTVLLRALGSMLPASPDAVEGGLQDGSRTDVSPLHAHAGAGEPTVTQSALQVAACACFANALWVHSSPDVVVPLLPRLMACLCSGNVNLQANAALACSNAIVDEACELQQGLRTGPPVMARAIVAAGGLRAALAIVASTRDPTAMREAVCFLGAVCPTYVTAEDVGHVVRAVRRVFTDAAMPALIVEDTLNLLGQLTAESKTSYQQDNADASAHDAATMHYECARQLLDTGLVPAIVALVDSPQYGISLFALKIVGDLCYLDAPLSKYVTALAQAHIVPACLRVMHASDPDDNTVHEAAWALGNLATESSLIPHWILNQGGAACAVAHLNNPTLSMHTKSEMVSFLTSLATESSTALMCVREGCIPAVQQHVGNITHTMFIMNALDLWGQLLEMIQDAGSAVKNVMRTQGVDATLEDLVHATGARGSGTAAIAARAQALLTEHFDTGDEDDCGDFAVSSFGMQCIPSSAFGTEAAEGATAAHIHAAGAAHAFMPI